MSAFTDQLATDLATTFLNLNEFAVNAVYLPAGGAQKIIPVLFDNPWEGVSPMMVKGDSTAPTATCNSNDVTGARKDDKLKVNNEIFYIWDVRPDGLGLTVLVLGSDPTTAVTADSDQVTADDDTATADET